MNYQKGGFNQQNWWYDGFSTIKWPNNRGLSNYDGDYTLSNEQAKMGLTINHLCVFSSGLTFFSGSCFLYNGHPQGECHMVFPSARSEMLGLTIWTWWSELAYNIVSVSELSQVCLGLSEVIVHCNLGEMVVSSKCSWDVLPAGYCPCCAGDFPQHCHGMCDKTKCLVFKSHEITIVAGKITIVAFKLTSTFHVCW